MDTILTRAHYRRTFYVVVVLVLLLALILRLFVLPAYFPQASLTGGQFLGLLLDTLVVSLLVTVAIGSFIFWLTPAIVRRSTLDVVEPKQINSLLKDAISTTSFWIYRGACGRFTRATTLPKLAEAARVAGIGRDVSIYILNPKNSRLCREYATYRRSLKSADGGNAWTQEVVQEELLATAVTAMKYTYAQPLLRIRLFFVETFSAFRLDISDKYVVVTKEEKEASALKADAGTYFYDSYKDDVRLTERQATEVTCCGKLEFKGSITESLLREAIKCADLLDDDALSRLAVPKIVDRINSPADPY